MPHRDPDKTLERRRAPARFSTSHPKLTLAGCAMLAAASLPLAFAQGSAPVAPGASPETTAVPTEDFPSSDRDGGDWTTFRGDLRRTGHRAAHYTPIDKPVELWRFDTGARVESSPTLWRDRLFVGSFSGFLYAIDAATGRELWRYDTGELVRASPSVADGVVYFGADDNRL
ncbi:MAG: PQQ-binding-like beta-propeller repeat protein, partial [Acidobacteriota bacterium]